MRTCKKCNDLICSRSKNWCEKHLNEVVQATTARRASHRLIGLCRCCNNPVASTSATHCEEHLTKNKEFRTTRRNNGFCRDCGDIAVTHTGFCEEHLLRHKKLCDKAMEKPANKFNKIKKQAERRKIPFSLSLEDYCEWLGTTPRACHYCGISEAMLKTSQKPRAVMSIDRQNNCAGYTKDNICLACYRCNNNKGAFFSESDWLEIAEKYVKPRLRTYHHIES